MEQQEERLWQVAEPGSVAGVVPVPWVSPSSLRALLSALALVQGNCIHHAKCSGGECWERLSACLILPKLWQRVWP